MLVLNDIISFFMNWYLFCGFGFELTCIINVLTQKNITTMRTIAFIMMGSFLIFASCSHAQTSGKTDDKNKLNEPNTEIKVNKEYDEQGNLIRYDLTYSYFYSNMGGDELLMDSIFNDYKFKFDQNFPYLDKPYFEDLFFIDSLLLNDFYKDDFFEKRFMMNMERMRQLFQDMDSMKNEFYLQKEF
jgi:hypothetical protein